VALRDYDCDGQLNLFTAVGTTGSIQVFHNEDSASGGPKFVLAKAELSFALTNTLSVNLNTGYYNMPSVQDVKGDGWLDILGYDFQAPPRSSCT
jgi:hypothetical protein